MGPKGPISVPALLDQLEAAVTAETRAGSAGAGGVSLPIGVGALSLLQDIERDARDHQNELIPSFAGTLKALIESWAVEDINGEWLAFLEHVTLDWIDQISAIIAPSKPPWRPHRPCPSCGLRYGGDERRPNLQIHCWDDEGKLLRDPESTWWAECVHCGAAWGPSQMKWFMHAIYAN
jgi:hypothetical protein